MIIVETDVPSMILGKTVPTMIMGARVLIMVVSTTFVGTGTVVSTRIGGTLMIF